MQLPSGNGVLVHWTARRLADIDLEGEVAILSPDERARMTRFVMERDQRAFAVARGFLRRTLSKHEDVAPAAWTFSYGEHGKPAIAGPIATTLRFNLSHTSGLVACAVARGVELGVDVERVRPLADWRGVAALVFTPAERALLEEAADERMRLFYEHWTLKEAYVKALGLGLSLPVERIELTLGTAPTDVRLRSLDGDAAGVGWSFLRAAPTAEHLLAVAAPPPVAGRVALLADGE